MPVPKRKRGDDGDDEDDAPDDAEAGEECEVAAGECDGDDAGPRKRRKAEQHTAQELKALFPTGCVAKGVDVQLDERRLYRYVVTYDHEVGRNYKDFCWANKNTPREALGFPLRAPQGPLKGPSRGPLRGPG